MNNTRQGNLLLLGEGVVLAAILLLAAYLRLTNVSENPGWYSDEGTLIDIAQHLRNGQVQYMAINQSTLLVARLPLFPSLLALLYTTGGAGIQTLRIFTGLLGVLSVFLLWWFTRRTGNKGLALLAAALLAIYPNAVIYSRIGFSYNLLTPLILLAAWGMWEYLGAQQRKWLALSGLAVGLGCTSDLMMFNLIPPLVLVIIARRWRDLLWCLPLVVLLFGVYVLGMMVSVPTAFIFDVQFTLERLSRLDVARQIAGLLMNITSLLLTDAWIAPALIGIFLLPILRMKRLLILLLLLPFVTLGRTVALSGISYYYITPLLPYAALGMAALLRYGTPHFVRTIQEGLNALTHRFDPFGRRRWLRARLTAVGTMGAVTLLIIAPFLMQIVLTFGDLYNGFHTPVDSLLLEPDAARAVAVYVNENIQTGETIIVSPTVGWMFHANTADFQMMVADAGVETLHLPGDIPQERFAFSPRYTDARFVVIDNLWKNWAVFNIPPLLAEIVSQIETGWGLVFEAGEIRVYENPELR